MLRMKWRWFLPYFVPNWPVLSKSQAIKQSGIVWATLCPMFVARSCGTALRNNNRHLW